MQTLGDVASTLAVGVPYLASAVIGFLLALVRERSRFVTEKRLLSVDRLRMASVELLDIVALVLASGGRDSEKLTQEGENRLGKAYAELGILADKEMLENAESLRKGIEDYMDQRASASKQTEDAIRADRDRFVASVRKQLGA